MKNIKKFDNFDKQEVVKEHKTLGSLLSNDKVNESATKKEMEFNLESVLATTNGLNVDIISKSLSRLVLKVNDFEASKSLGSYMWGISSSKALWDRELLDRNFRVYFVYDFSKPFGSKEHMFVFSVSNETNKIELGYWYDCTLMDDPQAYCDSIDIDEFED